MAKRNNDYKIDFTTNSIAVSKKFHYEAMTDIGSEAFTTMKKLRGLGFNIVVREPKQRKACPTRVTFDKMEQYIRCLDDAEVWLPRFNGAKDAAKSQTNYYKAVRDWFLENFPEFTNTPVIDENGKIIHGCDKETTIDELKAAREDKKTA